MCEQLIDSARYRNGIYINMVLITFRNTFSLFADRVWIM